MKLYPHLWFESQAEEAMEFYTSVFKDSKVIGRTHLSGVSVFRFELGGLPFIAINAGRSDPFNERVCLFVETEDQAETDYYWNALLADGGTEKPCGWLTDRFGVYWQVSPRTMQEMLMNPDRERAERVAQAMYKMKKIVIADLERAYRS